MCTDDPLAQLAEHLTFNQGVRSSSLRWVTTQNPLHQAIQGVLLIRVFNTFCPFYPSVLTDCKQRVAEIVILGREIRGAYVILFQILNAI